MLPDCSLPEVVKGLPLGQLPGDDGGHGEAEQHAGDEEVVEVVLEHVVHLAGEHASEKQVCKREMLAIIKSYLQLLCISWPPNTVFR